MQNSKQLSTELTKARSAVESMRNAKTLDEFEENWKDLLHHLERVWNKSCSHFNKSPKWNGWKGKFEMLRKLDPLLSYLINARGSDEHTVNEIVGREGGEIALNAADGKLLHIKNMVINNGQIFIGSAQNLKIDFLPTKTKLLPVVNRGRTYPVPIAHLGKPLDPTNVIEVAEAGIRFYESFLDQAEEFFNK